MRGRTLVVIDGAVLGTDDSAAPVISGLRELGPEMDTFARVPAATLSRLHMDPEGPTPVVSDTAMLDGLPDSAVDAFLAEVGQGSTSSLLLAELRQLGGALGRPHPGGGALDRLDAQFILFGAALATDEASAQRGHADARRLVRGLSAHANGRQYLNFAENAVAAHSGYRDSTWLQLKGIRSAVDPDGLFVANHRVPRLYEDGRPTD
jgi:hypothetical protein